MAQPGNIELLTPESRAEIDGWVAKYPPDQKQSAVMAALRIAQDQNGGYLTDDLVTAIAAYLDMPPVAVFEVATFYSMYELDPVGRHKICICTNISCMLRGSDELLLSLSIDRKVLLLNRDRLSKLFALELSSDETNVVRAETVDGTKRAVRLPFEVQVKERRALEALLRYGRLSEQELSQITASRRVGGMLTRLLARLESEGYHGLSVVGEGADGRIFSLEA